MNVPVWLITAGHVLIGLCFGLLVAYIVTREER
jgi:hypothetical protein